MKSASSCRPNDQSWPNFSQVLQTTHGFGVRPGEVLVGEVVDDAVEVRLEVEGVERDVEPVGDAAGVAGIEARAAALLVVAAGVARRCARRCA